MNIHKFISIMFTAFLVACSSISAPTITPTLPMPTATSSATSTITPAPTETTTPTIVPTPLGGTNLYMLSFDCSGLYVNETELIVARIQLEEQINKHFDCFSMNLSPAYDAALFDLSMFAKQISPGVFTEPPVNHYLLSNTGEVIQYTDDRYAGGQWSPDGSKILVLERGGTCKSPMYLMNNDGSRKLPLGERTCHDGLPTWSIDSSELYWRKYDKIRLIDAATGKSNALTINDSLKELPFSIFFSPNGKMAAYEYLDKIYIAQSDFLDYKVLTLSPGENLDQDIFWSSSSDRILVSLERNCTSFDCKNLPEIYLIEVDGDFEQFPVNIIPIPSGMSSYQFRVCGFSPDNKNLIFKILDKIYMVNVDTRQIVGTVKITFDPYSGYTYTCPTWIDQEDYDSLKKLFEAFPLNVNTEGYKWEFESNDTEGWVVQSQLDPLRVSNGSLITKSTGNDPYMVSPMIAANADTLYRIEIRMKASTGSSADFYFITSIDRTYGEDKKITFPILGDGQFHTYTLDLRSESEWENIIFQLRFDPLLSPGNIEIDYIRLLPP